MIAAGSVSAAASGLLTHGWCRSVNLIERLQKITSIDAVSIAFLPRRYLVVRRDVVNIFDVLRMFIASRVVMT